MLLENSKLYLRPVADQDLEQLRLWRNSKDFQTYCSSRSNQVTQEQFLKEFQQDFKKDRHQQFIIVRRRDGKSIGTIFSYNLNTHDGHVFITVFIDEQYRRFGYGAIAIVLFGLHLFQTLELHKIYCDVYSYNAYSLKALIGAGFVEEGRFREQKLLDGQRFDVIRLAFFQKQITSIRIGPSKSAK